MNRHALTALPAIALWALALPGAAQAQPAPATQDQLRQVDKRVGVLESQMRAVQREVFPGGDKRFFAPEVVPDAQPQAPAPGAPATAPRSPAKIAPCSRR